MNNQKSSGLNNLGNTCFFNSILQLLYQCTVLNKLILSNKIDGKLIELYNNFLKSYTNSSNVFSPSDIVTYVSKSMGRNNFMQEDADQYLNFIIDTLIEELNSWIKSSGTIYIVKQNLSLNKLVNDLFTIKINKTLICPECNYKSTSSDDINKLYLSINDDMKQDLNSLLNKYMYDILDDENKWKCYNCNKYVNARIERQITKLPKYLIIVLKRYKNNNSKINTNIIMNDGFSCLNKNYFLRGFVHHSGSTGGGHYVYYGNRGDIENLNWYRYNDSSFDKIAENDLDMIKGYGYIYLYVNK